MGVDTNAVIRPDVTLDQVVNHCKKYYKNVSVSSTHADYYFCINFEDGEDRRNMSAFFDPEMSNRDYGIRGCLMSLGFWGNSVEIVKRLCNDFGGYIDESDCDSEGFYPVNLSEFEKGIGNSPTDIFDRLLTKLLLENKVSLLKKQQFIDFFSEHKEML